MLQNKKEKKKNSKRKINLTIQYNTTIQYMKYTKHFILDSLFVIMYNIIQCTVALKIR